MSNNYTREYHPPHTNILSTFKTKTYNSYVRAIDEFIDNSIDAILRANRRNNKNNKFKITLIKQNNDLIVIDNGDGVIGEEIKDVVILGSSGTKRSAIAGSHGTFGAGATSAALYLANSETSCNLTVVSFRDDKASLTAFDLESLLSDDEPWGYDFCHDPNHSPDFQEKLQFLKSSLGDSSTSGTAIFVKDGGNMFPNQHLHRAWEKISKSIQVNYAKRFKDFSEMKLEIEFEFYSDGSKGIRKSTKAGFNSWTCGMDALNYSINPTSVVWYHGGADHQYERHSVCGIDFGLRMSQFMEYRDRDKSDPWAHGYMTKSPQGIAFIRNGKRIECSTTKGWIFDGWKRSILVEIEYEGDHHPHIKVNQEKTEVLLSEEFEKGLAEIIHENVLTAQDANNARNTEKTLDDANIEHVRQGVGQVLSSERKSKTDSDTTLSSSKDLVEGQPSTKRRNESYVGKTDNINISSSTRRTILPVFTVVEDYASRYTPFSKSVDISGPKPKTVITVNRAHPFSKSLIEAGCVEALFTMAAAMLIGPSAYDRSNDEIYLEIEKFGEMYSEISKASSEAKKNKLQIAS